MARPVASLPAGSRITDHISLGVIAKLFPLEKVREVLVESKRTSVRERDLPAHVVVYYVIALALYMRSSTREALRCLLEGVQWLLDPSVGIKVAGKSGISPARRPSRASSSNTARSRRPVSVDPLVAEITRSISSRARKAGAGGQGRNTRFFLILASQNPAPVVVVRDVTLTRPAKLSRPAAASDSLFNEGLPSYALCLLLGTPKIYAAHPLSVGELSTPHKMGSPDAYYSTD